MLGVSLMPEVSEFQAADWLYSLYRQRTDGEIERWLADSRTEEERRIKGWLVYGFCRTGEIRLIDFALRHRNEEPPHVESL